MYGLRKTYASYICGVLYISSLLFPPTGIQIYTKDVKWSLILSHLNGNLKYISINCHKNSFSVGVLKVCSADTKRSATSSQGIRGYIFLMTTLKSAYFLITRMMFCSQFL